MVEALMELKAFRSLGDALWFSISARHLVRDPTATDEGRYTLELYCSFISLLGNSYCRNSRKVDQL